MTDTLYPSAGGSNIGTLLRLIQEDQNKNISSTPPGAQPGSPIRNVVQGPLHASESPGSSQVISLRPEGVTQQGPQTAPVVPAGGVSPIGVGNVVAPRAPVIAPSAPGASSQPSANPNSPSVASSAPSAIPSTPTLRAVPIGTSIALNTPARAVGQVTPTAARITPQTSRLGAISVGGGISAGAAAKKAFNATDAFTNLISEIPSFGPAASISTAFLNPVLKQGLFQTLLNTFTGNKPKSTSTRI